MKSCFFSLMICYFLSRFIEFFFQIIADNIHYILKQRASTEMSNSMFKYKRLVEMGIRKQFNKIVVYTYTYTNGSHFILLYFLILLLFLWSSTQLLVCKVVQNFVHIFKKSKIHLLDNYLRKCSTFNFDTTLGII